MKARYCHLSPRRSWFALSFLLTVSLFFPEGAPPAQSKTERVAILKSANIAPYNQAIEAFKNNLPIRPSLIHEYNLEGELEKGPDIAQDILDSKVDLVLAVGLKATLVAKFEIREIPVIFCMVLNPKRFDLDAPNLKGIALSIPFKEQLLPMQMVIPTVSRIGVLYDPEKSGHLVKKAEGQAKDLGLELIAQGVASQKELPTALRQMIPRIHALWLLPDTTVLTEDSFDFLIKETLEKHVPVAGFSSGLVRKGALVGTYINYDDVGEQAAVLAKDLLNGHSLNGKRIIAPRRFRKAINLNTAHFFGLSISPNVLKEFDKRY
jgi:putative ABC transport system substrate-binding protein